MLTHEPFFESQQVWFKFLGWRKFHFIPPLTRDLFSALQFKRTCNISGATWRKQFFMFMLFGFVFTFWGKRSLWNLRQIGSSGFSWLRLPSGGLQAWTTVCYAWLCSWAFDVQWMSLRKPHKKTKKHSCNSDSNAIHFGKWTL
jgi:hypothetical protein